MGLRTMRVDPCHELHHYTPLSILSASDEVPAHDITRTGNEQLVQGLEFKRVDGVPKHLCSVTDMGSLTLDWQVY